MHKNIISREVTFQEDSFHLKESNVQSESSEIQTNWNDTRIEVELTGGNSCKQDENHDQDELTDAGTQPMPKLQGYI